MASHLDQYTVNSNELDPPDLIHATCGRFVYEPTSIDPTAPSLGDYIRAANRHSLECENGQ